MGANTLAVNEFPRRNVLSDNKYILLLFEHLKTNMNEVVPIWNQHNYISLFNSKLVY